jgi:hypothetical protein
MTKAQSNGVTKVETGKWAAQVLAAEQRNRRTAQTKGVQKAEKKQPKKAAARSKKTSHTSQSMIDALKGGATMDALCKLIGKHPHDVHCVFYRIRKLGHKIDFSDNNVRTYRIGRTDSRETKKATMKWC